MHIHRTATVLRRASSANALIEPADTAIGTDEYTAGVGFGSDIIDAEILFLEDAGAGAGVTIEVSPTEDFSVVTVPELRSEPPFYGGLMDVSGFVEGQVITINGLEGNGRWRVKNEMDGDIQVSYRRRKRV